METRRDATSGNDAHAMPCHAIPIQGLMSTEDRTIARDFVMARLAACRATLALAIDQIDEAIGHFIVPSDDSRGKKRSKLLESVDELIGDSARSVQLAQSMWEDVDPEEEEPDLEEEEDDDDEEDEDEDEED